MRIAHCAVIAIGLGPALTGPSAAGSDGDVVANSPAAYRILLKREAELAGLPVEVANAVTMVESGFDASKIGGVGEIGLMQVRPATAAMLGFAGSPLELAVPAVNIHFGVTYLAGAWRLANGDLCRALMKYRAGHNEESMTLRSVEYCGQARSYLASIGSPLAAAPLPAVSMAMNLSAPRPGLSGVPKLNIRLKGAAFWAAHDARVKAISARIERRWKTFASR